MIQLFILAVFATMPIVGLSNDSASTFYVQLLSAPEQQENKLMQIFGTKCYSLQDVLVNRGQPSEQAPQRSTCHKFLAFKNETLIQGRFPNPGSSYLVRVSYLGKSAHGQWRYSLMSLHRDGKELVSLVNAGEFKFPSDQLLKKGDKDTSQDRALSDLSDTILGMTFK